MDVKLVVKKGPTKIRTISLPGERTLVGRGKDCNLRIPSGEVSRRHCLLCFHGGLLVVEDQESVNGTFLNGLRISRREVVKPGDILNIGPLTFSVNYELTAAARENLRNAQTDVINPALHEPVAVLDESGDEVLLTQPILLENDFQEHETWELVADDEESLKLDENEPLLLPDGDKLRDILSNMDP